MSPSVDTSSLRQLEPGVYGGNVDATLQAGDTWTWTLTEDSRYPVSAGWVYTYHMRLGTTAPVTVPAVGTTVTVAATTSATWAPGTYTWVLRATRSGEVHTLDSGSVRVLPDPTEVADTRSRARRCLDAVEAALERSLTQPAVEYELDGVRVKHGRTELMDLRNRFRAEVRRESGRSPFTIVGVTFG